MARSSRKPPRKHLGACSCVFHELVSTNIHLDLYFFPATPTRPFETIVTVGCSDKPLNAPESLEHLRHVELVVCLPQGWPMPDGNAMAAELFWPFEKIKEIAQIPHAFNSFLGPGHTIPNGDPAEPYPGTKFNCLLLDHA